MLKGCVEVFYGLCVDIFALTLGLGVGLILFCVVSSSCKKGPLGVLKVFVQ